MEEYRNKVIEVAAILSSLPGVTVSPNPPHTNMMHVFLEGDAGRLRAAHRQLVKEWDVELFSSLSSIGIPSTSRFEFVVASATVAFNDEEIRNLFTRLLEHARD